MFLEKAKRGYNQWFLYVFTLVVVFLGVQVGSIPVTAYALAEAVLTLCEDVERRRQYGENGRRRVSRMYRLPDMVERYEILFERARRGAGGRNRV